MGLARELNKFENIALITFNEEGIVGCDTNTYFFEK